jgi:hypothetical protein
MGIFDAFGKKDSGKETTKGPPFSISTELVPYKLHAKSKGSAMLNIKVTNLTKDVLLTSVTVKVTGKIGFDEMVMQKEKDKKLGEVQPGEMKEDKFIVYSGVGSDAGYYSLTLTVFAHYRDYGHVLNFVKKEIQVGVV